MDIVTACPGIAGPCPIRVFPGQPTGTGPLGLAALLFLMAVPARADIVIGGGGAFSQTILPPMQPVGVGGGNYGRASVPVCYPSTQTCYGAYVDLRYTSGVWIADRDGVVWNGTKPGVVIVQSCQTCTPTDYRYDLSQGDIYWGESASFGTYGSSPSAGPCLGGPATAC